MKNICLIGMIMMMLVGFIAILNPVNAALITKGSAINADLLYYEPVPAMPGDQVDVWIQITNSGGSESKPGRFTILDSYPFSVRSDSDRITLFPSIPPQENFLIQTTVRIDKNANEGVNYLKVKIQENGKSDWIERDIPITIKGKTNALTITRTITEPEIIMPGEKGKINISIKNVGDTKLRNIDFSLDLTNSELAPIGNSNSKTITSLNGGETTNFIFNIIAYPDATVQATQIPIKLTYEDEQGNTNTQSEIIGTIIGTKPELLVYFEKIGLNKNNKEGSVVIKFANKGLSKIKLLEMKILENDDVKVKSESSLIYVGDIDEDDYESADLSLKVSKDNVKVPIEVSYRDSLNKKYTETIELPLKLVSVDKTGHSNIYVWIIIIVLLIAGWWFYKSRKNKK